MCTASGRGSAVGAGLEDGVNQVRAPVGGPQGVVGRLRPQRGRGEDQEKSAGDGQHGHEASQNDDFPLCLLGHAYAFNNLSIPRALVESDNDAALTRITSSARGGRQVEIFLG